MRIVLFCHPRFFPSRSMAQFADMLEAGYRARGHTVERWTAEPRLHRLLPRGAASKWAGYVDQYLLFPLWVRRELKRQPADSVFVFSDQALGPWVPLVRDRAHSVHSHDLLALRSALGDIPQNPTSWTGRLYQRFIRRGFRHARHFIPTSQNTRRDLVAFGGVGDTPMDVVYNGLHQPFAPMPSDAAQALLRGTGAPVDPRGMLLYVGSSNWYKNTAGVIRLYGEYARRQADPLPLWMITPPTERLQAQVARDVVPPGRVQFVPKVDLQVLQAAYSHARAVLFPSLAEGFGWPLIESQACGCPVVTTDAPPMNEVAGPAARYVPLLKATDDLADWARRSVGVLEDLLALDDGARAALVAQGRAWSARFSQDNALDGYLQAYQHALELHRARVAPAAPALGSAVERAMKILFVLPSLDPAGGGPAEGVLRRGKHLVQRGHRIELVTLDDPAAPFLAGYPLPVHALGSSKGRYRYNARLVPWLRAQAPRFDAVVVNGLWQYHAFGAWRALHGGTVPYYVFTHGMLDPWFKRAYPLKHLKKWLYWPWADYRLLRDARAVLFTSDDERRLARESFSLYRARETVVAYGTDTPPQDGERLRAHFFDRHPELRGRRLLLFLGRLHEKKGCDLLLRAFAEVVRADGADALHLVMAGPDQTGWAATLKTMARTLGIGDRVSWPGLLRDDAKWAAFHAADAFVLPSHQENFGIAVAEALGCGVPVLVSDKVNIWREIEADGAGIVDADSLDGTRRLLQRWLALDADARAAMAARARRSFGRRYTVRAMADGLLDVLGAHAADDAAVPPHAAMESTT